MNGSSRRLFLRRAASLTSLAGLARALPATASQSPATPMSRAERVYQARLRAATAERERPVVKIVANGDERRYEQRWGSFTKGLPHNAVGEVDRGAYAIYLRAIETNDHSLLEQIPLGGYLKLANPQAAWSIETIGPDAETLSLPPSPELASPVMVAELAELYWQALLRDVPFAEYGAHPLARQAAGELSALHGFRDTTPATLFRGTTAGGRRGYYLSQFLLRDIPMTPIRVPQKIRTAVPGRDFMTGVADWLNIQNGQLYGVNTFDEVPRYIRTGRDLAEFVHRDYTYQAPLDACLMLLRMSAPLDGGIPYQYSLTQAGFVTYGVADIFHHVAAVANLALKTAWYYKWLVNRNARPEEIGGRLHFHLTGARPVPFHDDIRKCDAWERVKSLHQTYLLPQAYPEAAPSHPAYPSGHAVFAGACVTVLKACFADSWVLPNNVVPSKDGTSLQPYRGPELTVGTELDKLAENIAFGRNFGGIHWRSDAIEGLRLGEAYALAYLREMKLSARDLFTGFNLTTFAGERVTV
jgi:hypothetical protein